MKLFFTLIAAVLLITSSTFAQKDSLDKKTKYEINLGYFNAFQLTSTNGLGVGFKRFYKKGALRVGLNLSLSNSTSNNNQSIYYDPNSFTQTENIISVTNNSQFIERIGYEFHEYYHKFIVYYGCDLKVSQTKSTNTTYFEINSQNNNNSKSELVSMGVSPLIGLRYKINNKISISTETSIDLLISSDTSSTIYSNTSRNVYSTSDNLTIKTNPLGILSFNIDF